MQFPNLEELDNLDAFSEELNQFFEWVNRDDSLIHNGEPFPKHELSFFARLTYPEIIVATVEELESLLWRINTLSTRIQVHINLQERALAWLNTRLSKYVTLVNPQLLSSYYAKEDKLQCLGQEYPVVREALRLRDFYFQQKIKLTGLDTIIERVTKMISFRLFASQNIKDNG